ncbi:MAG: UPF0182 family protein [Armatimonadetes bacterium]|nr:MAG: UPF0182 family protein [Armatimonadota bacterium]
MINREPIAYRQSSGWRRILIIALSVVFLLLMGGRWFATLWTDYLWYSELGATGVWSTLTFTKVWLVVGATIVAIIAFWVNLWVVDRIAADSFIPVGGPDEELLERYHEWIAPRAFAVRTTFAALFGLLLGLGAAAWWQNWLFWRDGVTWGVTDPIYGNDLSLYIFGLPLYRDIFGWTFQLLIVVTLVVVAAHYLNGSIKIATPGERTSGGVKAHISILLALIALLKAVGYVFDKWELLYSSRGQVLGASYTDVHAQIPALNLLIFISIVSAIILLVNVWFRGWSLPIVAFAIWLVTSIGVGGIYPAMVQRFSVEPNEIGRETEYVQHNLDFTRLAYGLDQVESIEFPASTNLTAEIIEDNRPTIDNIRLWAPGVLQQTYPELQNIKTYYDFKDVDVDRYVVNGELTQVMMATRGLAEDQIPGAGWVNERLVYTHGLGVVLSPANNVTPDGKPDFFLQDIPPINTSGSPNLDVTQPRVYFSDDSEDDFLIAASKEGEIDIPNPGDGGDAQTNSYDGAGGVPLGNFLQRTAWALRFADLNTLISGQVDPESRVMIARNIKTRIKRLAPFLYVDNDPYMVVTNGRLKWIMDLYTVSDRYPYSEQALTTRLNIGADLPRSLNYIRNSVKAVVDAYDGTVDMYVIDPNDPIIRSNERIFPNLFKPISEFPEELVGHLRYPEDLFRIQTDVYTLYHMTDPVELFKVEDPWQIARDPSNSPYPDLRGVFQTDPMLPYYLLMELPEEDQLSFLLMQPFTPADRPNMSAFMVAKSGPLSEYGTIIEYTMPSDRQVDGPGQVGDFIDQDPIVSAEFTLLGQIGSDVIKGNLLVVPIEDSLLYVQPIYLAADTAAGGIPQFKRVVASYDSRIEIGESLDQVLFQLFGAGEEPDNGEGGDLPDGSGTVEERVAELLTLAEQALTEANVELKRGNLAGYQAKVDEANSYIAEANRIIAEAADTIASGEAASFTRLR